MSSVRIKIIFEGSDKMVKKKVKSKKDKNKKLIFVAVAIAIIAAVVILQYPFTPQLSIETTSSEEGTEVGKKISPLTLKNLQSEEVSFSDFKGQNLIINSWAAWCPFCIAEMPDLQKISDENDDVTVLFVHRIETEPTATAQKFLDTFEAEGTPITDPVLSDEGDIFYRTFFGFGMPVSLFVDKNGVIQFKKLGPMSLEELRDNVEKYFKTPVETSGVASSSVADIKTLPDGTKYLVHPSNILAGGPPKGGIGVDIGISAIAEGQGKFVPASEATFLSDDDLVLGLSFEGKFRAYPHQILVYHEIANDEINGKPIVVTYCPLCLTGIAFSREVAGLGSTPQFGTSGKLYNSNLVMYDDVTDSYWYQQTGQAIVGELTGNKLKWVPLDTVKWGDWKQQHPETDVLSRETGFLRPYGSDPYGNYYTNDFVGYGSTFTDTRLHAKTWIHGIVINDIAKAYPRDEVDKVGLINDNVGGVDILVLKDPSTGTIRIFDRQLENEGVLTFELTGGKIVDNSGREWDFEGVSLDGKSLKRVPDHFGFWFSWTLAYPGTELFNQS